MLNLLYYQSLNTNLDWQLDDSSSYQNERNIAAMKEPESQEREEMSGRAVSLRNFTRQQQGHHYLQVSLPVLSALVMVAMFYSSDQGLVVMVSEQILSATERHFEDVKMHLVFSVFVALVALKLNKRYEYLCSH